ncbi:LamG domain-containing protein [Actinoplanes bogorensis]|uniref:LamG domain-containing protein n=1 Tax=Paractinoplanes bogorensis TaxID=1610840 RepID=A0ABS5Z3T5_9ACTN|nr:LamG-like jellyroll fold domain-containing protein [Actinoplanes bogorensis]MBU2670026.1 LamG domain-containing protein [Actinoplanes bogorensis]
MSRKRWWLALAGLLVLVGTVAHAQRPSAQPAFAVVKPSLAPGLLPVRVPLGESPAPPGPIRVAAGPVAVRYDFDGGVSQPITDHLGRHELRPLGQNGGSLRLVRQGDGLALSYPDRCRLARQRDCPRVILEGSRDDSLNPGTRRLRYGAAVRMTYADLADGANVVQKGYSVGGSQYKLQVDHRLGHPSCVIAGRGQIYRAEPSLDVADGRWHNLACVRSGNRLTLSVDGAVAAAVTVPAALSIANAEPLRVGGKGTSKSNDQFAGEIDNVFVTIS